jgi:hypothetical protein
MNLSEYSAAAGAVVNQFIETFDAPTDPYARAALRYSPFLLTSPRPRGGGVAGVLKDPRFVGGALVAGIVMVGLNRSRSHWSGDVKIHAPRLIGGGMTVTLTADVLDGRGRPMPDTAVTWTSHDTTVATIDAESGVLTTCAGARLANGPWPKVRITAVSDTVWQTCTLRVIPEPATATG